jgi:hypothetical protein
VEVWISVQDVVFRRVGDHDLSRQSCGCWNLDLDRTLRCGQRESRPLSVEKLKEITGRV